jgi:sigma-B regulation protein RsbU (phosphoserine phosphatase)
MNKAAVRVLLVEDNPGDVVLIREMLSESPSARFELTGAERLSAARRALAEQDFAVVLLDLTLPDSEGLDTFRAVRRAGPALPVVVLTGLDDVTVALRAVEEGAQDYLVKGEIKGRELGHALWYAVGRQQRQRHIELALHATEEELHLAKRIHEYLLPREHPAVPGFDIFGASLSAHIVGGDLFDYLPLPDGTLGLAVADVTGHDLGSALLMAAIRSYLRAFSQTCADAGQILSLANRLFAQDVSDGNNCTLFLARLDAAGRSLAYASAGHPPALVVSADGTLKAELKCSGFPLGIFGDVEYAEDVPLPLRSGDVVLLYTDGLADARSPTRERFDVRRILDVVRAELEQGARLIVEALMRAAQDFARGEPQPDDITAVVIKVTEGAP